ncbi:MBL fold metallo-hydrolase [Agromyces seonyuensis]|uniref:MBL fold metallo-hydrolase n=1 Tax=Agromyces seonyuensis TaxID=2662446 RepID=UPI003014ED27
MRATSTAQFEAAAARGLPPVEEVRPGVHAVPLVMPGQPPFSYAYLIEGVDGAVAVHDPGWDSDENAARLADALASIGKGLEDVSLITASHQHPDHLCGAARLRAASGARILLHEPEAAALRSPDRPDDESAPWRKWGIPITRLPGLAAGLAAHAPRVRLADVDGTLVDGEALPIAGRTIRVVATPGHTSGHICLLDEASGVVFTGDSVLPTVNPGIGLGGWMPEPIASALDSLERVAALGDAGADEALPGHEYRFDGLAERARALRDHHLRRAREVAAVVESDPDLRIWDIASRLTWSAGFEGLRALSLASALAQTAMHRKFVASEAGRARLG